MATRIEIELTSRQDDGATFTWRAAGAKEPKGAAEAALFPTGADVGDEFRVEAEMDLDGIRVINVLPPEKKGSGAKAFETLELIGPDDDAPLVTQQLAPKRGRRDGDRGRRGDRRGGERRGGGARDGRDGRSDRPRTPAKPKLPPKPKPPRLKAGRTHRKALMAELGDAERPVAEELLKGGMPAVRAGLAKQNEDRKAAGEKPIDDGPLLGLAEKLLVRIRAAEWRDRAEAALEQAPTVDLRDLRSVVTAADGAARDDEAVKLADQLRTALNDRLEADHQAWIAEIVEMLEDDRSVRALHLSSRPPKAGAPLPAAVATRLVEAANASLSAEASPERWAHVIEALAHSPVRRQVIPVSLPTKVSDDLRSTIARFGDRLPEIAQIFGVEPDPKAGRKPRRKKKKPADKSSDNKSDDKADGKAHGKTDGKTEPESAATSDAESNDQAAAAPTAAAAEPAEGSDESV